jgi:putative ABC transport system permease protein
MPDWKPEIRLRLAKLKLEPTREAAIIEELTQYLDDCYAELLVCGATEAETYQRTLAELSGSELLARELRRAERQVAPEPIALGTTHRRTNMIADLWQDLRYALRMLRKNPGFTAVAVITLAFGIGVNTTLFSVFNSILLQQPTALRPERLVYIEPGNGNQLSYPNYLDLSENQAMVAGYRMTGVILRSGEAIDKVSAMTVTGNFFEVLGARPVLGRTFTSDEAAPERTPALAVLAHNFWRRRLNGDPAAIGQTINLNGQVFTVVGVLPKDYRPITGLVGADLYLADLYLPLSSIVAPDLNKRDAQQLNIIARLEEGASHEQLRARLISVFQELERRYPQINQSLGRSARVFPVFGLASLQSAAAPPALFAVLSLPFLITGLLLAIACANIAGLLLSRGAKRRREIAIRLSLGASRARLIRTLLTESLVIASSGAIGALLLTGWLTSALSAVRLPGPLSTASVKLDLNLLLYTIVITGLTCLLCGLAPAWQATKIDVIAGLKDGVGRRLHRRFSLQSGLVVGQVTVSIVLLITSLLFLRSLIHIGTVDTGFDMRRALIAKIELERNRYTAEQGLLLVEQSIERIEKLPGVESASVTNLVPLGGDSASSSFEVEGQPGSHGAGLFLQSVGGHYFRTMGIDLRQGRDFLPQDRRSSPLVAIVNESFAKKYFPGETALGKRVRMNDKEAFQEIVGVVADSKYQSFGEEFQPILYRPYQQGRPIVIVRTAGEPANFLVAVKQAISDLDKSVPVETQTMEKATRLEFIIRRTVTALSGAVGAIGLTMAMIGLYGVMAFTVSQRAKEIGIRMSLGATRFMIFRLILRRALALVGTGIAIGTALALGLTRALAFALAGVKATDPMIFAVAALILLLVGILAGYLPARRASRVDPMVALRDE